MLVACSGDSIFTVYTNEQGQFSFHYKKGDTFTITKEGFHAIHIVPVDVTIDAKHIITISMVPGQDNPSQSQSLQSFKYHFIHDSQPNQQVKATVLENPAVSKKRKGDPSF